MQSSLNGPGTLHTEHNGVSILEGAGRMMVIGQSAGKSFMF